MYMRLVYTFYVRNCSYLFYIVSPVNELYRQFNTSFFISRLPHVNKIDRKNTSIFLRITFNFLRQLTNSEPNEVVDSPFDEEEGDIDGESDIKYDEQAK